MSSSYSSLTDQDIGKRERNDGKSDGGGGNDREAMPSSYDVGDPSSFSRSKLKKYVTRWCPSFFLESSILIPQNIQTEKGL